MTRALLFLCLACGVAADAIFDSVKLRFVLAHKYPKAALLINGDARWGLSSYGVASDYEHVDANSAQIQLVNDTQAPFEVYAEATLHPPADSSLTLVARTSATGIVFELFRDDEEAYREQLKKCQASESLVRFVDASNSLDNAAVYALSSYCNDCLPVNISTINATAPEDPTQIYPIQKNDYVRVPFTQWSYQFGADYAIPNLKSSEHALGYRGVYTLFFLGLASDNAPQVLVQDEEPESGWLPLVVALSVIIGSALCYVGATSAYSTFIASAGTNVEQTQLGLETVPLITEESHVPVVAVKKRVDSLDTFRGGCLAIMIFVNYGGGDYWFFDHSYWNGLTVADLVFPWFVFIMGTSTAISLNSQLSRGASKKDILGKVAFRAAKLLALGLFLNNGHFLDHWRIPGVLQYFAVAYLAVGLTVVLVPTMDSVGPDGLKDLLPYVLQWAVALMFPIIQLAVTFGLYVPGCGRGYIGPGGISDGGKHAGCVGGASTWVDHVVFGENHYYDSPTCADFFRCGVHDPEGLLGAFNCIFMAWLGLQCGRIIIKHKEHKARLLRFAIWGAILLAFGGGLCEFKQNGGVIPVNKNLWSLSFITVLAGGANWVLGLCYIIIDVKHWWAGMPLRSLGMNSIVIYCGHELLQDYFPFSFKVEPTHAMLLFENLVGAGCWLIIGYLLYRQKIFFNL